MKELKPMIVYEDKINIKKELKCLDTIVLPYCTKIQREFEKLGIGEISDNYLTDIFYNSCSGIEAEVNKDSIPIKRLRNTVDLLLDKCNITGVQHLLRYLSISQNGNIVFSEISKEELKDCYRQYVRTETGITRRQLHEKAVKALNEFKKAMDNTDVIELFDIDEQDNIMPVPVRYE